MQATDFKRQSVTIEMIHLTIAISHVARNKWRSPIQRNRGLSIKDGLRQILRVVVLLMVLLNFWWNFFPAANREIVVNLLTNGYYG